MDPSKIIEAYVADVMRHLPRAARNDIGLELRGLLAEMLNERTGNSKREIDGELAIGMLREFGTPEETAARYIEPAFPVVPAHQTASFALLAIAGVLVQWAVSLPAVIAGQPVAEWWFGKGLGALWWPGFMVLAAFASSWLRHKGYHTRRWSPPRFDHEHFDRRILILALFAFAIGTVVIASLPLIIAWLPEPQAGFFELDEGFLLFRAPLASILWLGQFGLLYAVQAADRWTSVTRRLALLCDFLWVVLLVWWLTGGPIFRLGETDAFVKSILGFVLLIVGLSLIVRLYRQATRIRVPAAPA
jgi:hypothetical protein